MVLNREGTSTSKPPLLDGSNYAYWKQRMIGFLKSIDDDVWDIVEEGYSRPTIVVSEQTVPKPRLNGLRVRSMPPIVIIRQ